MTTNIALLAESVPRGTHDYKHCPPGGGRPPLYSWLQTLPSPGGGRNPLYS